VALRVPIDLARRLARVEGAHSWVVLLDDTEATAPVLADLRARFPESEAGFQYVPWHDLADFYKKVVVLFTAQVDFVRAIIAVIILVSISNTLIMGVLERTAEVGTLMAIGFRRARILRLFVGEGLLLGVLGSALGTAAGLLLARVISAVGIPMPPSPGMDFSYTGEIRVTLGLAAGAFLLAVAAAVLASVYPAWKASRLLIVDALRRAR
jgi:putative ABC transport system permease protein